MFLKLDVEGSELAFLRGAGRMISQKMPRIMIELNPESLLAAGKKLHELIDFLRAAGYCDYIEKNKHSGWDCHDQNRPLTQLESAHLRNVIILP